MQRKTEVAIQVSDHQTKQILKLEILPEIKKNNEKASILKKDIAVPNEHAQKNGVSKYVKQN